MAVSSHAGSRIPTHKLTLISSDGDEFSMFHRPERCLISLEWEVEKDIVILQLQNAR
jgi:hypothetical protein